MKHTEAGKPLALVWSDQAANDLYTIADFIAADDPVVAVHC